ncbi:hypothetical protein [Massilia sp. Root335]|uniref:hypothetical protein n=1 Tax=Massilia sp. Root335 TaxID=1736517 RepID=UPI000A662A00|nr:hypothetical protein [Massilia sp. Root335]
MTGNRTPEHDPQACDGLAITQCKHVDVHAALWWNAAALHVRAGETYDLRATGQWYDAAIRSTAAGYASPLLALFKWARRARDADWFSLVAAVHPSADLGLSRPAARNFVTGWIESRRRGPGRRDRESHLTDIGEGNVVTIAQDGYLYLFANDAFFAYCNNKGTVSVSISRLT